MRTILSFILSLFVTVSALAQTPPTKVPQTDGTIQLVPVPPATVFTPYFIDPTIGYQLYLDCPWANVSWNGNVKNGKIALKGQIITADLMAMPIGKTKVVDGKTITMFSIYRSTDAVIQFDNTRLELLPINTANLGPAFDRNVMDASKITQTVLGDGLVLFHSEALKVPEQRTPKQSPLYYQWNFDGFMWQGGYRVLGRLQFRVKDDYYLPTWGQQRSFVRVIPSTINQGNTITTKIDGSPTIGTDVLRETRSQGEQIMFGAPAEYKVAHYLSAPTTKFKIGDTIPVQIMMKPETKPQMIYSVCTNFVWNPNVLEFVGLNRIGSPPSMENAISMPGVGNINETSIPKDGNAMHNWLNQLGNRKFYDKETLIVTLNFKVVADFNTTKIEIVKQNDPRLVGLWVMDDSTVMGSSEAGVSILGAQNGVAINGMLP